MNTFKTRAELKGEARQLLLGNYSKFICTIVLSELIINFVTYMVDYATFGIPYARYISFALTIIVELFSGILIAGSAYFYLNAATGKPAQVSDIFHCFTNYPNRAILVQVVFVIVSLITAVPSIIFAPAIISAPLDLLHPAILILETISIVLAFFADIFIGFSFYMMHDFPSLSAGELLKMCLKLMKGYKKKLIMLNLSFLPLYLLGFLSFGLGLLWITPYVSMCKVNFYLNLVEEKTNVSTSNTHL